MPAGLQLSVRPSLQFRDALGRFARPPTDDVIGARLIGLGQDVVDKLRPATPVRTGQARTGWTAAYRPTSKSVEISNRMNYANYLITGTRSMRPNRDLQAVVAGIPDEARVTLRDIGQDLIDRLKGAR